MENYKIYLNGNLHQEIETDNPKREVFKEAADLFFVEWAGREDEPLVEVEAPNGHRYNCDGTPLNGAPELTVEMWRVLKFRDGNEYQAKYFKPDTKALREDAIRELYEFFWMLPDDHMLETKSTYRASLEQMEDEDGKKYTKEEIDVLVDGFVEGIYNCNNDRVYDLDEYPKSVEEWITRDIDRYREDVYTYKVVSVQVPLFTE